MNEDYKLWDVYILDKRGTVVRSLTIRAETEDEALESLSGTLLYYGSPYVWLETRAAGSYEEPEDG